ncbi:uncharacterized protein LOC119325077 [Triticum dicoccoides]|nr:uncharacterized protein LOC119325077 [Triticum dicoccoides]
MDGSTWRMNKFTDFSPFLMPHPCDSHLWERHLFHRVPWLVSGIYLELMIDVFPGESSWTPESPPGPDFRQMANYLTPEQRDKSQRHGDDDVMDVWKMVTTRVLHAVRNQ